ncbi:MAG TPA: phosphodiester glycosidase family protein [Candidatus Woesebacteria bacterium]|nr:phosphodiester glycosidase family protein [Candidatus Woesebacteria bacterium]HPR99557.1 phosphodiester glycosidase family protein [Candidatus Woesebacteria bacterium]
MKILKQKISLWMLVAGLLLGISIWIYVLYKRETSSLEFQFGNQINDISSELNLKKQEIESLKNDDQYKKNLALEEEIKNIQKTYDEAVKSYEDLIDLRVDISKNQKIYSKFSQILAFLSKGNYASASANLLILEKEINSLRATLASKSAVAVLEVKKSNETPVSGYSRQGVEVDGETFVIDILAASLDSTKVIVETASESDCVNNCPVSTLADFVSRGGGFAGINGPYFCPAEYPSCSGKTNSFDTLLMNKNKYYFNSSNNVYSSVPALIFSGNSVRLVGKSSDWGRDTGVDSVIASQPLLLSGGEIRYGDDNDAKRTQKGSRSFIAYKGNLVYIGVVRNATVAEVAKVLKTLGIEGALNLDSGGSTAFWVNGKYVAGPGRQTPFGIVLVKK